MSFSHALKKSLKRIRPKVLRREIFLRYRLPQLCAAEDVNFDAFDRVAIFKKSKVAFNRLKKNANSTATIALTRLETGRLLRSPRTAKYDANRMDSPGVLLCDLTGFDWLLIVGTLFARSLSIPGKIQTRAVHPNLREFRAFSGGLSPVFMLAQGWGPERRLSLEPANRELFLPVTLHNRIIRFETFGSEFLSFLQEKDQISGRTVPRRCDH